MEDKLYTIKVWLTTLILSPILFNLLTFLKIKTFEPDSILLIFFMFGYSLIYSLPSFLIYHLSFLKLKSKLNEKSKFILIILSIILMIINVRLVFGNNSYNINGNFSGITFSIIYCISIIISSYYFKIHKTNQWE